MAVITSYMGSFENEAVYAEMVWDDASMLIHGFNYRNSTALPAYLEFAPTQGAFRPLRFVLDAGMSASVEVPRAVAPTLHAVNVSMGWPAEEGVSPLGRTRILGGR